jgi:hypothetical protein
VFGIGAAAAQDDAGLGRGRGNGAGQMTGDAAGRANGNGVSSANAYANSASNANYYANAVAGELPESVIAAITAAINDEYHAYEVYDQVIEQFGQVSPFVQIQAAEANHIAALERVFDRYGLEVPAPQPVEALSVGSIEEACALAAQAEIDNAALYDEWLATVSDYPDIVQVFTSLKNASLENHLPAFEACAQ